MTSSSKSSKPKNSSISRRSALIGMGATAAGLAAGPGFIRYSQAQSSEPIKIGFQCHRTGIGAAYGRWYERTTMAAANLINERGGINGRPLEIITEDDGTDPRRGAETVEKFVNQHNVDVVYGTLFSHVVIGSAPTAGELKVPYYVVSEGYHVPSGRMNRWCFQPGITDVRSQMAAVAPWVADNVGKKITMIYPDYAFGHDHRDYFPPVFEAAGGEVIAQIPIPPTETSFTRYFPQIPAETDVIYHVMIGPAILTFVRELGEFFGGTGPELFGFIDSLEAIDVNSPGLEFLEGSHFWEGMPRYLQDDTPDYERFYRDSVGIDENGASVNDSNDVSTAAHMFGCWETLFIIKEAMEAAGYSGPEDRAALVEATEALERFDAGEEHPQGEKLFVPEIHQSFGHQNISVLKDGRLDVIHRTAIEDSMYEPEADYRTQEL